MTNLVTRDKTTASKQHNSAHDDHDGSTGPARVCYMYCRVALGRYMASYLRDGDSLELLKRTRSMLSEHSVSVQREWA